jgi:hypothetical protein
MTVPGSDPEIAVGLGVVKCTVPAHDPTVLRVTYYRDDQATAAHPTTTSTTLRTDGTSITFPGQYRLTPTDPADAGKAIHLDITTDGSSFDLVTHRDDEQLAQGVGLPEPKNAGSVMTSWWWGELRGIGIVDPDDAATAIVNYLALAPDRAQRVS